MKVWAPDHPKAKLMARKRASILGAAREAFLRLGYEGTSMETIADAADVSIMTLYRHAESKDDLFAAVIANACDPDDEAEQAERARLAKAPLGDVLMAFGLMFQHKLADPDTVALLRAVMSETTRFPQLGETAYRGFVGHLEAMTEGMLSARPETQMLDEAERHRLAGRFVDSLVGADMLRILLGLSGASDAEQQQRAERARDELLAAIA